MSRLRIPSRRRPGAALVALATVALALFALSGCSLEQVATGKDTRPASYLWLLDDVSASAAPQRRFFEDGSMATLRYAADRGATVYAGPIDGNLSNTRWLVDGVVLRSTVGAGNPDLNRAARRRKAARLRPVVRTILRSRVTDGSDILGALQRVGASADSLADGGVRTVVCLTDGALNVSGAGGYSVYDHPPVTAAQRRRFIAVLRRSGELPHLRGRWDVYVAGLGVGVSNRRTARAIVELWRALVPSMGAGVRLRSADSTLPFAATERP